MQRTITTVTDDIDGSADAETYRLALDGLTVEIDLSKQNADKLYNVLAPYLDAGRRLSGKRRAAPAGPAPEIRQWWKDNPDGLPTWQPRGAVPAAVTQAWQNRDTARRRKRT
jgi:hypothetical protein